GRTAEAHRQLEAYLLPDARRHWKAAVHAWRTFSHRQVSEAEGAAARAEAKRAFPEIADAPEVGFGQIFDWLTEDPFSDREIARAHATRGLLAYREGDLERAARDLRSAMDLEPTAFH